MNILQIESEKLARKHAEKRELEVSRWIGEHGFTKLLFGRWLVVFCDFKKFNFGLLPKGEIQ